MSSVNLAFIFIALVLCVNINFIYFKNTENIPPQVIKKVLKEINEITTESLDGIRLIPNEQDICDIQAFIDGPGKCFK